MEKMVDEYLKGAEVVYGVQSKRDIDILIFNHADYRLISSRVLNELAEYKEVNLFFEGISTTSWV